MSVTTPWTGHFSQIEVDEVRPLLDFEDPIEHYLQVRDVLALGATRFEAALRASIGKNFPPTVVLRSLVSKSKVPLILEWPKEMPSVAIQCQLALLLAMANEPSAAQRLAEKLAPIVLGGFWTLWTLEKEYNEEETRLSCALFLRAIGQTEKADQLYCPILPKTPFFAALYRANPQISIPIAVPDQAVWTLNGSKAGIGAMRLGAVRVVAIGPHAHPLSNANLFGISEAGTQWFCSAAQKDVWFQIEPLLSGFSLHSLGITFEKPIAFVFYVKAGECRIGDRTFKPKSLHRFLGEASSIQFDQATLEVDRPLKVELIPLSGSQSFWGADFLLAFWLSPISSKIFFRFCEQ